MDGADGSVPTLLERFKLDGRVAIVTGASSGLGAATATALAQAGADVVIGARRPLSFSPGAAPPSA